MGEHMSLNIIFPGKSFATLYADKVFITSMCENVCVKMAFLGKSFPTLQALKVFLTSVGEHVFLKIAFPVKLFPTLQALKVFLTSVGDHVLPDITLMNKHSPTVFTSEVPHAWAHTVFQVAAVSTTARPHALHGNTSPGGKPAAGGVG